MAHHYTKKSRPGKSVGLHYRRFCQPTSTVDAPPEPYYPRKKPFRKLSWSSRASLPALLPRPEPRHLLRGPESLQYLGRSSRRSLPHFRLWRFSSWRLVLHGLDRSMASGLFLDFLASGTGLSGKGFANRVVAEHLNVGSFDIAGSALPSHPDLPGRSHGRPRRSPNLLMQIRSGLQSDIAPGHLHPSRHSRIIHLPRGCPKSERIWVEA